MAAQGENDKSVISLGHFFFALPVNSKKKEEFQDITTQIRKIGWRSVS
jgi:hypothetical protein